MDEIIKINLFGDEFRFKADEQVIDSEIIVQNLITYIEAAQGKFQKGNSHRIRLAILLQAAMNISKDYHELKLKYSRLEREVEKGISKLNQKINIEKV